MSHLILLGTTTSSQELVSLYEPIHDAELTNFSLASPFLAEM